MTSILICFWGLSIGFSQPIEQAPLPENLPEKLTEIESLSTQLKSRLQNLSILLDVSSQESVPMLSIESAMMDIEHQLSQIDAQISSIPSHPN